MKSENNDVVIYLASGIMETQMGNPLSRVKLSQQQHKAFLELIVSTMKENMKSQKSTKKLIEKKEKKEKTNRGTMFRMREQ